MGTSPSKDHHVRFLLTLQAVVPERRKHGLHQALVLILIHGSLPLGAAKRRALRSNPTANCTIAQPLPEARHWGNTDCLMDLHRHPTRHWMPPFHKVGN